MRYIAFGNLEGYFAVPGRQVMKGQTVKIRVVLVLLALGAGFAVPACYG